MAVRLGFAVAIQVDADILLIDEVLAVGDAAFQQKCFEQFETLKAAGKTIIFVTHDMSAVEHFCDRAMLLERGELVAIGAPGEVARRYNQLNFGRVVHADAEGERQGDRVAAEITAAWFEDSGLRRQTAMPQGEFCHVCVEVTFHEDMQDPIFAWSLRNESGLAVMNSTTFYHHPRTGHFKAGADRGRAHRLRAADRGQPLHALAVDRAPRVGRRHRRRARGPRHAARALVAHHGRGRRPRAELRGRRPAAS